MENPFSQIGHINQTLNRPIFREVFLNYLVCYLVYFGCFGSVLSIVMVWGNLISGAGIVNVLNLNGVWSKTTVVNQIVNVFAKTLGDGKNTNRIQTIEPMHVIVHVPG